MMMIFHLRDIYHEYKMQNGAEPGARANDLRCHASCSEQHESRHRRSRLILNDRRKKKVEAVRYLVLALYGFGLGLIGHGWITDGLSLSKKIIFSVVALVIIAFGVFLQLKWKTEEE